MFELIKQSGAIERVIIEQQQDHIIERFETLRHA
jgi:hypothetical protein